MTVLTKLGLSEKKDQLPLVEENAQHEAKVEVVDLPVDEVQNFIIIRRKPDARLSHICCFLLSALVLTSFSVFGGIQMYVQMKPQTHRYQGWCAIPYDNSDAKLIEPHFRLMTMPQSLVSNSHDVEILDDLPQHQIQEKQQIPEDNYLKETFYIGENYERIMTDDFDGRRTNILHDFSSNVSGIIDKDRCFVMTLNTTMVMEPNMFVSTIQKQSNFDMTEIHDIMRAILPALADLANMGRFIEKDCADRPTYMLKLQPNGIRKRSADIPNDAKFAQFAGRHIQKIDIANLDEISAYEEKMTEKV